MLERERRERIQERGRVPEMAEDAEIAATAKVMLTVNHFDDVPSEAAMD